MRDNLKDLQNNLRQRQGMKPKKDSKPFSVRIAGPNAIPAPPVPGDANRMGPPKIPSYSTMGFEGYFNKRK